MMLYWLLFLEFFKVGLFTIGGGMAALPLLYDLAGAHGWFTAADVTDMLAISQSTPGPIGVNMATFIGYRVAGLPGSLIATIAVVLPECVIVLLVANYFERFKSTRLVTDSFSAIRPAVTALITLALWDVVKATFFGAKAPLFANIPLDPVALLLFAVALFAVLKFKKHPILYILGGAVAGILFAPSQ